MTLSRSLRTLYTFMEPYGIIVKSKGVLLYPRRMANPCPMVPSRNPVQVVKVDNARSNQPDLCLALTLLKTYTRPLTCVDFGVAESRVRLTITKQVMGYSLWAALNMATLRILPSVKKPPKKTLPDHLDAASTSHLAETRRLDAETGWCFTWLSLKVTCRDAAPPCMRVAPQVVTSSHRHL